MWRTKLMNASATSNQQGATSFFKNMAFKYEIFAWDGGGYL
jgi:hypothetical protein